MGMSAILKNLLKSIFAVFIRIERGKIVIIDGTPYSGSNAKALYDFIKKSIKYNNIKFLTENDLKWKSFWNLKVFFENFREVCSANIVVTTHLYPKLKKTQIYIQLWHGIPLKAMTLMDKTEGINHKKLSVKNFSEYDYIISSSQFYSTLLNACVGVDGSKYVITGFPRNDMLFNTDAREKLQSIVKQPIDSYKIVFYLPTFRVNYGNQRIEGTTKDKNIFGFDDFDYDQFNRFLAKNNILFITKLHPVEEKLFIKKLSKISNSYFIFLTTDVLKIYSIDLYEILGSADILITDYSSVYFDYLLLNRPLLFISNDIDIYEKERGFLLKPYDFWTPGPKVKNQRELQDEIVNILSGKDTYKELRTLFKTLFHVYNDNKSCERVWNIIKNHI
ncbi:CDP-glycerol:poly(glycerophosphate) glycerophosphotransferase [Caldicellulosiruptor kronotskyensis 2002]|uniref:CDP-glycerol:poly(Glycerophosphate) glycerophosphotransferase n=2 Tax=Caldicellulosiruptor TaxID=44000 RepID=E4SDZ0_CALK2|nr:CDP-glycerol:poly(glycerophosphate) glycerophosphotransferase [Caldicellulosiruptor kronotskyensis 2002]